LLFSQEMLRREKRHEAGYRELGPRKALASPRVRGGGGGGGGFGLEKGSLLWA